METNCRKFAVFVSYIWMGISSNLSAITKLASFMATYLIAIFLDILQSIGKLGENLTLADMIMYFEAYEIWNNSYNNERELWETPFNKA